MDLWTPVTQMMQKAVAEGVFPGAVLLAGDERTVFYEMAVGVANRFTDEFVRLDTVFDLASLTKPLATTLAVMALVEEGRLRLDSQLGQVLPEFRGTDKQSIEIRHLLYHSSGMPAYRHYYRELKDLDPSDRRDALRQLLVSEPLERPIDAESVYSDLGFMVLCWVIETVTGCRLDRFVHRRFYRPLALQHLFFIDGNRPPEGFHFAATDQCPWRNQLLRGCVSDDNAWVIGGIDGHAGLFGTSRDVYRLLGALMASHKGATRPLGLSPALIRTFLTPDPRRGRAVGFDIPAPEASSCGTRFSSHTVGHLGFTGTSFWMDLKRGLIIVLLTNRVHPSRENDRIRAFRPVIHDRLMDILLQ